MTRPRLAAIISGVIASTAAFVVVSRWGLLGTVGGAALIPAIYTLVSHWSTESLERLGKWVWRRVRPGRGAEQDVDMADASTDEETAAPAGASRSSAAVWPLTLVAVLALGLSVYSLSVGGEEGQRVIEQRIVERTVVVTVPGEDPKSAPATEDGANSPSTTAKEGQPTTTVTQPTTETTGTTDGTEPTLPGEEPQEETPTTTNAPSTGAEDQTPVTTVPPSGSEAR